MNKSLQKIYVAKINFATVNGNTDVKLAKEVLNASKINQPVDESIEKVYAFTDMYNFLFTYEKGVLISGIDCPALTIKADKVARPIIKNPSIDFYLCNGDKYRPVPLKNVQAFMDKQDNKEWGKEVTNSFIYNNITGDTYPVNDCDEVYAPYAPNYRTLYSIKKTEEGEYFIEFNSKVIRDVPVVYFGTGTYLEAKASLAEFKKTIANDKTV